MSNTNGGMRTVAGSSLAAAGSVGAAVASSACCWLPLAALSLGTSAAGAGAFMERWRPFFGVGAIVMLGVGFYLAYFRNGSCAGGGCDARARGKRRLTRAMLWVSALVAVAFLSFPKYAGAMLNAIDGDAPGAGLASVSAGDALVFRVEGMTCEACASTLQADLANVGGVAGATVDYPTASATIHADGPDAVEGVRETVELHGYTMSPEPTQPARSRTTNGGE